MAHKTVLDLDHSWIDHTYSERSAFRIQYFGYDRRRYFDTLGTGGKKSDVQRKSPQPDR